MLDEFYYLSKYVHLSYQDLLKLPTFEGPGHLYRGTYVSPEILDKNCNLRKSEPILFFEPSYLSSSTEKKVAERFASDSSYPAGTVVKLGGVAEITRADDELCDDVFGVVSTRAAFTMNGAAGTDETHPAIAMTGRVPVLVTGVVRKGDRLVSAGNGYARAAARSEITPFNVIGRALENKLSDGYGTVEAIVKIN